MKAALPGSAAGAMFPGHSHKGQGKKATKPKRLPLEDARRVGRICRSLHGESRKEKPEIDRQRFTLNE
jgi:hypothetical protein